MDLEQLDWAALDRLRASFLDGSAGQRDYWADDGVLASYDQTFAQRIGWKWDYVLDELKRLGWSPPPGEVLDWGCGTGVASRAFLDHFGAGGISRLRLFDRSPRAAAFAAERARLKYPGLSVDTWNEGGAFAGILIISHVVTELNDRALDELIAFAQSASVVLWAEPGTPKAGRRLITARERLRGAFHVVAPCPHQGTCGTLLPQNQAHWCHHFAPPPPAVFTNAHWAKFAKLAGIDLRSLPVSYLILDRRPVRELPVGTVRVLGRVRIYKPHLLLQGCDATGLREQRLTRRALPDEYRELRKGNVPSLQLWECEGEEITRLDRITTH